MGGSGQSGNPNAAGGQLGQMANPQTKDPMQNLNRQGAPNFKGPAQQPAQQPYQSKPELRQIDPAAHLKPMPGMPGGLAGMGGLGGPGGPRTSQFPTGPSSAEQMAQNIPAFLQNMRGTPFGNSQMGQLLGQSANPNTSIQPAGRAGGK